MVPSTGGTQTQITSNAFGDDFRPDWSPVGNEVALARTGSIWLAAFAVTGISVSADVTPATPAEGDSVTYTITAANSGPHDATGVEVTDMLPAGVTFVSASATQGAYASGTGVWTVGALPVSAAESLTVVATVDAGTDGQQIDNLAQLTASDSLDADTGDDQATASFVVTGGGPTGAEILSRGGLTLEPPAPSPFRERTSIRFSLSRPGPVSLAVYDVQGRMVRHLVRDTLPEGVSRVEWNGRDARGGPVPAGVYFLRLRAEGADLTRKVVHID